MKYEAEDMAGVSRVLEAPIFYGERFLPRKGNSGWYLWSGDNDGRKDFFQPLHLKHVIERFPSLKKYLELEPGWSFVVDISTGYEDIWFDQKKVCA